MAFFANSVKSLWSNYPRDLRPPSLTFSPPDSAGSFFGHNWSKSYWFQVYLTEASYDIAFA